MSEQIANEYTILEPQDSGPTVIRVINENFRRLAVHNHADNNSAALGAQAQEAQDRVGILIKLVPVVDAMDPALQVVLTWGARDADTGLFMATLDLADGGGTATTDHRSLSFFTVDGVLRRPVFLDYRFSVGNTAEVIVFSNEAFEQLELLLT